MGFSFAAAAARPAMASTLPGWSMLDCFVFWSENFAFPKDAASTLASGTNSMDQKFRICFKLVDPPEVSRLYLQMEEGLWQSHSFEIVAAHRAAVLLQMSYPIQVPGYDTIIPMVDHFLYRAASWLPAIQDRIKARASDDATTNQLLRRLHCLDLGVLCRGGGEVAVAELEITGSMAPPKLHVLCPSTSSGWEVKHPPIIPCDDAREFDLEEFLRCFDAHAVVPFRSYLCWVDYSLGILFCDVFDESPKLLYLELPAQLPRLHREVMGRAWADAYHAVGVTEGEVMKFVKLVHDKDRFSETIGPATDAFTITSWALRITESDGMMKWEQDAFLRSSEIGFDGFTHLPRVDMYEPSVVYFMVGQDQASYIHQWCRVGDLCGEEALYFAREKPQIYTSFLPAEFAEHLNLLGTR
ncbi:hypothetical protein VPH35_002195 [Triticum aestivum]